MRVTMKLGCLENVEVLKAGVHPMSRMRQEMREYRCERLQFDLPNDGVVPTDVVCSACENPVSLRLTSPANAYSQMQTAFLAVALIFCGISLALYFTLGITLKSGADKWIIFGSGGVGLAFLAAAFLSQYTPIEWIKTMLATITNDSIRYLPAVKSSGYRGHKLLEIDVK